MDVINLMEHISNREGRPRKPRGRLDNNGRAMVVQALRHYASCQEIGADQRIEAASLAELLERR